LRWPRSGRYDVLYDQPNVVPVSGIGQTTGKVLNYRETRSGGPPEVAGNMHGTIPSRTNELVPYRPACPKCGVATALARIEVVNPPDHDLRTFECVNCSTTLTELVRYKHDTKQQYRVDALP
jgi:hypothetical protein